MPCLRVKGISLWDPLPVCCFSFLIPSSPRMKLAAILEALLPDFPITACWLQKTLVNSTNDRVGVGDREFAMATTVTLFIPLDFFPTVARHIK